MDGDRPPPALAIETTIAETSVRYATAVCDRIVKRADRLATFPLLGAVVPEYGDDSLREIAHVPYRIIYRVSGDELFVVAVIYGARQLPPVIDE